ncbi:hypothetical protein M406DRAFT_286631 [Cryphonectria parasitica EP155]|uniref:Non-structural maintenance of chromosomes element 4 n=1 Tax=Cryphonectria parasitica (strain ATCC 38755 / EP155) TaxID=660469 RepID=A0A9P4Y923_CRYP1|nr:uncharacterized protein M406DRAFT_286631 [Cryphonectria parasitica EP155]KAF3768685.1 hypothetical protein M406DRAFT_286631 [Cryphonectria parasitica EP155]
MSASSSDDDLEAYDPDQDLAERRQIQRGIRALERDMLEKAEEYLVPSSKRIGETLKSLNEIASNIKQTTEAAIDSRALLTLVDLNHRKLQRMTAGHLSTGVDPDEFVSKCITYMRRANGIEDDENEELTYTQRRRRGGPALNGNGHENDGSDDDDDAGMDYEDGAAGDTLNWSHLGRYACVPAGRRPPLSGHLLGPLSVEKKTREVVVRSAPLRLRDLQEVRPQVLNTEDLSQKENDLTAICNQILKELKRALRTAISEVQRVHQDDTMDDQDVVAAMERVGLTESGSLDLVRFCINPRSFGQTVENMFYVSFLIREGMVEMKYEENGLPSLCKSERETPNIPNKNAMRRQAIMSIDMPTWRDLITTFNIKKSMIEHRYEAQDQPGARGWYT